MVLAALPLDVLAKESSGPGVTAPVNNLSGLEVVAEEPAAAPVQAAVASTTPAPTEKKNWFWRVFGAENWRVDLQATYIWQKHLAFSASYDGPHSLISESENGYTLSSTLYVGLRLWRGAEIFVNPEVIQSVALSQLHGLGGMSNAENQKSGAPTATIYNARVFIRQTVPLGGKVFDIDGVANQFSRRTTSRRLVITFGQMALIDIFDNNAYAHDGRTQFMNWALLTYGASDYAADARGYTWGVALEYYHDDWAFRFGHFAQPKESNGLAIDFRLWEHFGDVIEIERVNTLWNRGGKVRLYGFANYANMGGFRDALTYASLHGGTPDLANVRRNQAKFGFGIAIEQELTRDAGLFVRFSWNDGRTETYAFTEIDQSFTVGGTWRGRLWHRPKDTFGLAVIDNEISQAHRDYLAAGGLGAFLGDGRLSYAPEWIIETYYSLAAFSGLWLTFDYQFVDNPGYNAARGPVHLFGLRAHAEF